MDPISRRNMRSSAMQSSQNAEGRFFRMKLMIRSRRVMIAVHVHWRCKRPTTRVFSWASGSYWNNSIIDLLGLRHMRAMMWSRHHSSWTSAALTCRTMRVANDTADATCSAWAS
jgi:hypothetical protein